MQTQGLIVENEMILGWDELCRHGVVVDSQQPVLQWGGRPLPLIKHNDPEMEMDEMVQ